MKNTLRKTMALGLVCVSAFSLMACGKDKASGEAIYKAGTYKASATGYNQEVPIEVEVKVSESAIEEIKVVKSEETEGIGAVALEELPAKMVEANGTEVEAYSGATVSSDALKTAVNAALEEAKAK